MTKPDISIVIPMYNEEDNVIPLCDAVREALKTWDRSWELILVEDGSSDATLARLLAEARDDRRIQVVPLKRNSGQTLAMATGFQRARGSVIVGMDGDLQNDPIDIPKVVEKLDEGYDVVCGWRKNRQDTFVNRTLPSKIANFLIANLTGIKIHDNGCSLKAYRGKIMREVTLYSEMHRFLPALSSMTGARIAEVVVSHHPRIHGESKYGISRTFKVLLDMITIKMITQFARRPGRWFALLALPWLFLGLVAGGLWMARMFFLNAQESIVFAGAAMLFIYLFGNIMTMAILSETMLHNWNRKFLNRLSSLLTVDSSLEEVLRRHAPDGPGASS